MVKSSEAGPRQYAPPANITAPARAPEGASNDRQHPLCPRRAQMVCPSVAHMPACPFERSRRRLTNFRRRKERSYPCKERGARAVIQHVELQVYLFRRIREDLIRNHVEGPKGFRALLAPWTAAGFARIVGDDEIRFPDPNNR